MKSEARLAKPLGRVLLGVSGLAEALRDGAAGVLSFGLCGGLDPSLTPGDLVVGSTVLTGHRRLACEAKWVAQLAKSFPEAIVGAVLGADFIVESSDAKAQLRSRTGAIAADMESHRVALAASEAGVPFVVLRAVSDGAADSLPLSAQAGFRPDGSVDVLSVVQGLLRRPRELPALLRTARHADAGFKALATAARGDILRFR